MKFTSLFFLAIILALATSLPWKSQIALLNSLQVGRDEDPLTWGCHGCDESNKPLASYIIEEKAKDVKCSLSLYEEYTVLAFRYTATLQNVYQDILWAFQTQDQGAPEGCKVQRQFDRMWNIIRNDVLEGLRSHAHTGRLIITGISLGGGLSCLSYVDIAKSGIFQNVEIITFGAPRVGNKNWANWFNSITSSIRYFIKGDPIAILPRCLTFVCNYQQTGTPYVCDKNLEQCTANGPEEQMTSTEFFKALAKATMDHYSEIEKVDGIVDHIYGYKQIREYTQVD